VARFSHPTRPFTITRSTYAGGQRYSSGWAGDNIVGDYQSSYTTYRIVLHGLPAAPLAATADEQLVALGTYSATETTVAAPTLIVSANLKELKTEFEAAPAARAKVA
jgi:hypothetical protein